MSFQNGWSEHEKLVLYKLDQLSKDNEKMDAKVDRLQGDVADMGKELAALKVKSGIWGGVAGTVTTTGILLWLLITGKK